MNQKQGAAVYVYYHPHGQQYPPNPSRPQGGQYSGAKQPQVNYVQQQPVKKSGSGAGNDNCACLLFCCCLELLV
ncbi:hypothetical protein AYI70_g3843 [Smittium culicis]|uniref:Uncharacterized protein n=1 Tax=Smittium culicis TaxID=133412 RepID=A0A1R1XZQ9_9FUNG|nr:hypothetical protein AYI70_g4359 [Smittium culicis]OMJ20840.1 hypothetical protein AYI70_g3843 [Smittium culicis]